MVKESQAPISFTPPKEQFHHTGVNVTPMRDTEFKELLCNRFVLAQEASGLRKGKFAARVGISGSQFSNIKSYRNPPERKAIANACTEFGFTTDFFYRGERAGMRDPSLPEKIQKAQEKLGLVG